MYLRFHSAAIPYMYLANDPQGQWAVEQAVAHCRIDVLLRVARTGAMIFHRAPRRTPAEERRGESTQNDIRTDNLADLKCNSRI